MSDKLIAENLTRYLKMGFGRAELLIQQGYDTAYRDIVLHACLHNVAFDRQVEGSRAEYMFEIIKLTGDFDYYRMAVLEGLIQLTPAADEYDVIQLYDLAILFAQAGFIEAEQAILDKFNSDPALSDFAGAHALIRLNGREGFIDVAEKLSEYIRVHGEEFTVGEHQYRVDATLHSELRQQLGDAETHNFIMQLRQSNPKTIPLLDRIEQKQSRTVLIKTALDYEVVKQLIEDRKYSIGFYAHWGKQASEVDLLRAAQDLSTETDIQRLKHFLGIFRYKPFPIDHNRLFELAQNTDRLLAIAAINALKIIDKATIRTFAIENIERGYMAELMVELLQGSHFEQSDWLIIESLTRNTVDPEAYHSLGFSIFAVFDRHTTPSAISALLNLYDHNPCSACRERIVERLYSLKAVPSWMERECSYDANLELRRRMRTEFQAHSGE